MDNQHRKITGYRELSEAEIHLMNEIKAKGAELEELIGRVRDHVYRQKLVAMSVPSGDEAKRLDDAEPGRWASIARTDFQTGLMALTRAVAQPTTF